MKWPPKLPIKILYEDKDLLAIDKPAGISVHGDGKRKEETVADWFAKKYPKSKNVGEPMIIDKKEILRPGIVHRLDKDTSGVLLLAKTQKAYEFLKHQFAGRVIKKVYNALVYGSVKNDSGIINAEIGRSKNDPRLRTAMRGKRGKLREAITEYKVLKRLGIDGEKYTWLEVRPKTGRTHQIRVHLKFLNHPVVCDKLYSPQKPCPKSLSRLALHAQSIEFKNLASKNIKVESPLPRDLKSLTE